MAAKLNTPPEPERMTPAEFDRLVPVHYGTRTILVGPDLAQHVLDKYNSGNRRLSALKVSKLASQFSRGEYENTGEPIILSREGVLNDGQHRLQALIDTDSTLELDVRFGIARSAFTKTDTGSSRSSGDVLTIAGASHGSAAAQAVRLLLLYERGLPESVREFVSNSQVAAAYERWADIADAAERLAGRAFPKGVRSTPLTATVFLASRAAGKRKLDEWLEVLETGLVTSKSDPAYQLREYLMRGADAASGTREAMLERFATMLKSWQAFRTGQEVTGRDIRWKIIGKEAFPVIKDASL